MYLFLTLDPCNCWWLHMDLPPSWVQRFHCRKWCDVKSCARDQLVTSWKGSAGIFSTKNSSERSLDSALRYRIHIRPSPIAKLPPNPLLPLFFGPTPKPLSWPKHLGSRVAFYLGTKLHFFRSDVGQSWKRKNFHRLGLMFLPSKRQKSIYGFPHGFYAQNGDFLCVFFFLLLLGMLWIKKNQHPQKNASNFNQKSPGKSIIFQGTKKSQHLQAVCLATTSSAFGPRVLLRKCQKWMWQWARPGNSGYPRIWPDGGFYPSVKKRPAPRRWWEWWPPTRSIFCKYQNFSFEV